VALPTLVILAPVAGYTTSSDPPAALRHSVPKTRPRQVSSMRNFPAGAFIALPSLLLAFPWPLPAVFADGEVDRALRDIQIYTASVLPGHSPCDFAEQAAALAKPIFANRLPAKIPA
jgi:hypothetical protein